MKIRLLFICTFLILSNPLRLGAQCHTFTQEHVDLLSVQWNVAGSTLSLMASDDDHSTLYASNQCVVLCPESMRLTLPAGTPLGNEGDPLWILPQNPYPGVPYVGVSAESITPGTLQDPLTIQLKRLEGPGHFMVWQSVGFGQFEVKLDTRDGIGANDKLTPFVGGHEHYNWGFTTSGIYRAYFQVIARRPGQSASLVSAETPFTFHVLPLKPFETWQAAQWPCECRTNIILPGADPDSDGLVNAAEYALGANPQAATITGWPEARIVTVDALQYGALTFPRSKYATDCAFEVIASDQIPSTNWQVLTTIHSMVDEDAFERVTVRDSLPLNASPRRFYRLRVELR